MIILTIYATVLLSAVWFGICNQRTFAQRLALLCAFNGEDLRDRFTALHDDYDKVSYEQHMLAVATFRDPYKLYSQSIQDHLKTMEICT